MRKIISILLTTSMLAGSAAMPFAAIAAEKATTASRASEAAKTGTLTVTVYNEDDGGLYTDERTSFMITGSPDQTMSYGMGGSTFLCSVKPSESNPFVLNDIDIISNTNYTIIDSGSPDYDGFNYRIDYERSDRTFKFTENPNQDLSIYMKKNYFVVNSDKSVTVATHGQDIFDNMQAVMSQTLELINSDDFKALATADRISKAKELMKSLSDEELIADYAFDAEKNVMKFTYKCGTITGQLRPAVFEDEHKQLETTDIITETIPVTTQTAMTTTTTAVNSTIKDLGVFEEGEKMTLDDVIELSKKGNALTLNDLAKFKGVIAGSGIFILEYDLGKGYTLMVGSMTLEKVDYARLRYSGSENYIDIRTDDVEAFIAEMNANNDSTSLTGTKDMTLNDVMRLAELGDELDWADFKDYKGRDVGSGLYIWEFTLEDGYVLDVGGTIDKKPLYILLSHDDDKGIDIRTDDVKEYIASMTVPVVNENETVTYKIITTPDKTVYKLGESINLKGIQVEVQKGDEKPVIYAYPDVAFDYQSNIPKAPTVPLSGDYKRDKVGTVAIKVVGSDDVLFTVEFVDDSTEKTQKNSVMLTTESGDDGCDIHLDLMSGTFTMSGSIYQNFAVFGKFERKGNDLYLYAENGSTNVYVLHREDDHFISQSDESGIKLTKGLVFTAENDAFWEKLTSTNESTVKGDANCDDQVDLSDAVMIMQALANPNKYGLDGTAEHHLTEQGKLNGDMNGDGLTSGDALAIQRKLLGLDDEEKSFSATLLGIDKAKVIGVKVTSLPEGYDYSFTDKNAQAVVDYLSNISLSMNLSVEDPGQLNGMTWVIKLNYENGDTVTLYDLGKFIHGTDSKWYEMTYEESQELSNLIWKLGQTDNDKSIDNSAIAGKIFAYEKEGAGGYCTLSFNENGRFLYSPGKLSSYMGGGDWKIDGDTVSLIGMVDKTIYLKITDDTLVYIAESSDEFPYMDIKDGEKFAIYRPEISSDKFQLNSRYSEYGLGNPKVELNLIASELPEFCYVENVRLYDEDDNFIGMMSPAMDADIWSYLVDCNITEECSKTYYTLTKIRCGQKTYLDDVRSEITVNFKVTPAP